MHDSRSLLDELRASARSLARRDFREQREPRSAVEIAEKVTQLRVDLQQDLDAQYRAVRQHHLIAFCFERFGWTEEAADVQAGRSLEDVIDGLAAETPAELIGTMREVAGIVETSVPDTVEVSFCSALVRRVLGAVAPIDPAHLTRQAADEATAARASLAGHYRVRLELVAPTDVAVEITDGIVEPGGLPETCAEAAAQISHVLPLFATEARAGARGRITVEMNPSPYLSIGNETAALAVVAAGSITSGFSLYGPFLDTSHAAEWAEPSFRGTADEWTVLDVARPCTP